MSLIWNYEIKNFNGISIIILEIKTIIEIENF